MGFQYTASLVFSENYDSLINVKKNLRWDFKYNGELNEGQFNTGNIKNLRLRFTTSTITELSSNFKFHWKRVYQRQRWTGTYLKTNRSKYTLTEVRNL